MLIYYSYRMIINNQIPHDRVANTQDQGLLYTCIIYSFDNGIQSSFPIYENDQSDEARAI